MELTTEQMIRDTHAKVQGIEQLLRGYNGESGLCRDVENNHRRIHRLELLLAFAAGGGGITGAIAGISKLVGG